MTSDKPASQPSLNNHGDTLALANYAERAYLEYAVSVVKGRALPDVADGQKPVQRRILYAMRELGLGSDTKPRKSATVVGDVLGKFHPHGDQSVYDAMVRMAQHFVMRYPLVDGHGNFGSRDGDGAAAMRYTEARLTPLADLLLAELDFATIDFQPNYDGSREEPLLLPARLPLVLLNGASGIAVGMATEIPSHNLREITSACITLIKNPSTPLEKILELCPAPDFATGAQLISDSQTIHQVYDSGRGTLRLRARYHIEERARGQWQLVFDELPPQVSTQKVLEEIEDLTNPKPRLGKKAISAEQIQLKQEILAVLDQVRDESGRDAAVRLVCEPRSKNIDVETLVMTLLTHTSLEANVSVNLVMIGRDGRPQQKNLLTILNEWIAFRHTVVERRSRFQLEKILARIHILQGRQLVLLSVDKVIKTIRESDDPKPALIHKFQLTEVQAEDILEMRLRQLAKLEGFKIERELEEKATEAEALKKLLGNDSLLKKQIIKEIEADAKAFGDPRRTLIEPAQRAQINRTTPITPITLTVSVKGWLQSRPGHEPRDDNNFKPGDSLYATFYANTSDTLLTFGSDGRVYSANLTNLNTGKGDGIPLVSLIDLAPDTTLCHFVVASGAENISQKILLANSMGYGFIANAPDLITRNRGGRQFINLTAEEKLLTPIPLPNNLSQAMLCTVTTKQMLVVIAVSELKELAAGGRGTQIQQLANDDTMVAAALIAPKGVTLWLEERGKVKEQKLSTKDLQPFVRARASKGSPLSGLIKSLTKGARILGLTSQTEGT